MEVLPKELEWRVKRVITLLLRVITHSRTSYKDPILPSQNAIREAKKGSWSLDKSLLRWIWLKPYMEDA